MGNIFADLQKASEQQKKLITDKSSHQPETHGVESKVTRKVTSTRDLSRDRSRDIPRRNPRKQARDWPTRDEIQEFSFRLRDEHKVKIQAEVPYQWQDELDQIARKLRVKKLELYRFVLGEFLGKVQRGRGETDPDENRSGGS